MIDHIGISVSDIARAKAFYTAALAPLGYTCLAEFKAEDTGGWEGLGFGVKPKPDFWLSRGAPNQPVVHVSIAAENREQVDAFYAAAMAAGGRDNGGPGVRAHYHPHYYGAFVLDPDGHNIEAVCHAPPVQP